MLIKEQSAHLVQRLQNSQSTAQNSLLLFKWPVLIFIQKIYFIHTALSNISLAQEIL